MPLTKEDSERAVSILEGILEELGVREELGEEEDGVGVEDLYHFQAMVDVMRSPLFSQLVEIRNQYEKEAQQPQAVTSSKRAEVKLSEEPELVEEFCQRYGIASSQENGVIDVPRAESPSFEMDDELVENLGSPSGLTPDVPPQARTETTAVSATALPHLDAVGGGGGSPVPANGAGIRTSGQMLPLVGGRKISVTLSDLAQSAPTETRAEIHLSTLGGGRRTLTTTDRQISETSLSTVSTESTTQPKSPEGNEKETGGEEEEEEGGGGSHTKDILYFMRDKRSMTDIQEALHGRHGRAPRKVRVHQPVPASGVVGLGMEVVGLSSTGVFVSELEPGGVASGCGLLQVGDQILEVNGQSTEGMADFEVEHTIKDTVSEDLLLKVQYNPAGLTELKRVHRK